MKKKILSLTFSSLIIFTHCLCMEMEETSALLFNAIQRGSYQEVGEMVAKDKGIVHAMRGRYSPLMKACMHDKVEIAQFLIGSGANSNQHSDTNPIYAIHLVNSIEMLKLLHKAGADINVKNENNVPVLLFCAYKRKYDCIGWLLEKKAVVEGDLLERISNNRRHFEDETIKILLDMLEPHVKPDTCCVCCEEKKWPEIRLIPCYHPSEIYESVKVVNHLTECLCNECHEIIKTTTNSCPLCRKELG